MIGCTVRRVAAGLAFAGVGALGAADELRVSARLQPAVIGLDELAHFTIEVEGGGFGGRGFDPEFELDNFTILSGPSTSQNFRLVNGVASRSEARSWVLRPQAVGRGRVHSIRVEIAGRVYAPGDTEIAIEEGTVGRPGPGLAPVDPLDAFFPDLRRRQRGAAAQPKVFLRADVEPRDPFVGQQALYTLYLYTQTDVESINPERLPEFNGLWVRDLPHPAETQIEMVDIDGERFGRTPILRRAIFPLREGEIELEAAKVQLGVRVPDRTFGSLFAQSRRIARDSNPVTVTARRLPPPPPGFQGAVGELEIATVVEPAALRVGDAATFAVTLSGAGHLQGLPPPQLPAIPGVRAFPPQQESDERVVGSTVHGRRTWTFVLVPESAGHYELPAVEMRYFDPADGHYETAGAPALALAVRRAPPATEATADATPRPAAPQPPAAAVVEADRPWHRPALWGLAALSIALVAGGATLRSRRRAGTAPATALASTLRRAGQAHKPREAAALIEEGWRAFLAARWDVPPGTPTTQWGRQLDDAGCSGEAAVELVRLADDLHYLRYAPQLSDVGALQRELIVRSRKLARTLE